MNPLNVAQIGCGAFAEQVDLPNFQASPRIACRWCCDVNEERARKLARRFGVPHATVDYREALADPEVDFVKISTSHDQHLSILRSAAEAGKHVFCEKPLTMDVTTSREAVEIVRRSGIRLCVDYNRRMAPALQALKRRWLEHRRSPVTGPWRYVEVKREMTPEERETHLLIRVQDDSLTYRPVHIDPKTGGGQIIGESVHWLDLACWWFDPQQPVAIQAWGSPRFSHGIHLRFSEGDRATILFDCGGTFDYPKERYEVTCLGTLCSSEGFVENRYFGRPETGRETFAFGLGENASTAGWEAYLRTYRAMVESGADSRSAQCQLAVDKGHRRLLEAFAESLTGNGPSPCDEQAGMRATWLATEALRSIEEGKKQLLNGGGGVSGQAFSSGW